MEFRDFFHVRNSVYGPKGGEQHSLADEGAQFRQIDRKPGSKTKREVGNDGHFWL